MESPPDNADEADCDDVAVMYKGLIYPKQKRVQKKQIRGGQLSVKLYVIGSSNPANT